MLDLTTIQTALGSVSAATDLAKIVMSSSNILKDAETKLRMAELITALADAKMALAGVQETLYSQERTLREMCAQLAFSGNMQYEAPYYWNAQGDERDGPFCQPCWDGEKKAIRLQSFGDGSWHCKVCDKHFTDKTYRQPDMNSSFGSEF